LTPTLIGGIAGVASFIVLVLIIVCVVIRVRLNASDQHMKKLQGQMDNLEMRVAKECKEGKYQGFMPVFRMKSSPLL